MFHLLKKLLQKTILTPAAFFRLQISSWTDQINKVLLLLEIKQTLSKLFVYRTYLHLQFTDLSGIFYSYQVGIECMAHLQYDRAVTCFTKAIMLQPEQVQTSTIFTCVVFYRNVPKYMSTLVIIHPHMHTPYTQLS